MHKTSVAALVDDRGNPASFSTMAACCVFSRTDGTWRERKVAGTPLEGCADPADARARIRAFISSLGECRTIIGRNISGIPYNLLNQSGFRVFETERLFPGLLDEICEQAQRTARDDPPGEAPTLPQEGDEPGIHTFDLAAAMAAHPDLTSKKALLPFFDTIPFVELRLFCNHIPPWFQRYCPEHGLAYTQETAGDGVRVTITRVFCAGEP
jgi:Fe-only nitrogenase accessory protein AnfO